MKARLYTIFLLTAFLLNCSNDDDESIFPRKVDIEIVVNSSDNDRLTEIETLIFGPNLELRTRSHSSLNFPYKRTYLSQEIPDLSSVNVNLIDYSGPSSEPYTVDLIVIIDGDVAKSQSFIIQQSSPGADIEVFLPDYFRNK